ncbi:NlpC/P60 family protein [Fredinandcohnia sp. 179-A 10B2 NHS]|uniref:NlpC/P60 family protein n=1 Tax=Fredinandcohnia sp. 179-A 10B2 NHS TaxID=3235176 RepID=UPI0039A18897
MKKVLVASFMVFSIAISGLIGGNDVQASSSSITSVALDNLGVPYQWGGTTTSGFDCSGFINYTYKQLGISLPRTTSDLFNYGKDVSKGELLPGDIVFFTTYKAGPSHAGIYIGNNEFVHASTSRGVTVDSLSNSYYQPRYLGAKRVGKSGWELSDGKWYYYITGELKKGWLLDGSKWYYLDPNGVMKTGWIYNANTWYFLDKSGAMKTGWVWDSGKWYYMNNSGSMQKGWILDRGTWYYLYSDGSMAADTVIDGYKVNSSGAWVK